MKNNDHPRPRRNLTKELESLASVGPSHATPDIDDDDDDDDVDSSNGHVPELSLRDYAELKPDVYPLPLEGQKRLLAAWLRHPAEFSKFGKVVRQIFFEDLQMYKVAGYAIKFREKFGHASLDLQALGDWALPKERKSLLNSREAEEAEKDEQDLREAFVQLARVPDDPAIWKPYVDIAVEWAQKRTRSVALNRIHEAWDPR